MPKFDKLRKYIKEANELKKLHWKDPKTSVWIAKVLRYLKEEIGDDYYNQFYGATHGSYVTYVGKPDQEYQREHVESVERYKRYLESFLEVLQEEGLPEQKQTHKIASNSKKVFVVHGHDLQSRDELVKILKEEFGLDPIVLMDQPNRGKTLIEKFENNSLDIGYVFVILAPDDIGSSLKKVELPKHRTRENVILE